MKSNGGADVVSGLVVCFGFSKCFISSFAEFRAVEEGYGRFRFRDHIGRTFSLVLRKTVLQFRAGWRGMVERSFR